MLQVRDYKIKNPSLFIHADFVVKEGEILGIQGPSGCGKSTLLKSLLSDHIQKLGGDVLIQNQSLFSIPVEKRGIGYMSQDPLLFPHMSVRENCVFSMRMKKYSDSEIEKKLSPWVERFHMQSLLDRLPENLSGGEKQRVSMIRMFCSEPKIILLDEPTTGLDDHLKEKLEHDLKKYCQSLGVPVLWVSHDDRELKSNCNQILNAKRSEDGLRTSFLTCAS